MTTPVPPHLSDEERAPRTYQCQWRWNDDKTAVLQTAEHWLEEEADIYAKVVAGDDKDEDDNRAGIMRAIAKEIATLRRERSQWAEEATRLVTALSTEREAGERDKARIDALAALLDVEGGAAFGVFLDGSWKIETDNDDFSGTGLRDVLDRLPAPSTETPHA